MVVTEKALKSGRGIKDDRKGFVRFNALIRERGLALLEGREPVPIREGTGVFNTL